MHRFITVTPAQSRQACMYIYTYAHTAKRCLDPPRTTPQFAHALHTATSTSALTPTKNICEASSAYQIPRYTCVLNIRRPMHTHARMPVYNKLHNFHYERARSFTVSVRQVSVRVCAKFQCEHVRAYLRLRCKRTRKFKYTRARSQ